MHPGMRGKIVHSVQVAHVKSPIWFGEPGNDACFGAAALKQHLVVVTVGEEIFPFARRERRPEAL